jgi:hypothetical protein
VRLFQKIQTFFDCQFFFSQIFFFHVSRTFVEQMHRFKRFVVKSFIVLIVFSNDSSISNNSFDEFFTTINENSSTSCVDFKFCASNENVDVSSKSSIDIKLSANDNNNESIKIWWNIELFTSTSWFSFTRNLAIRSTISFEKKTNLNFKRKWYHWQWFK